MQHRPSTWVHQAHQCPDLPWSSFWIIFVIRPATFFFCGGGPFCHQAESFVPFGHQAEVLFFIPFGHQAEVFGATRSLDILHADVTLKSIERVAASDVGCLRPESCQPASLCCCDPVSGAAVVQLYAVRAVRAVHAVHAVRAWDRWTSLCFLSLYVGCILVAFGSLIILSPYPPPWVLVAVGALGTSLFCWYGRWCPPRHRRHFGAGRFVPPNSNDESSKWDGFLFRVAKTSSATTALPNRTQWFLLLVSMSPMKRHQV